MEVHNAAENDILYRKLESNTTIRLVNLPPRDDQEINISLSHYDFEDGDEEYEALSYVWGSPFDTKPIICEGQTFHVTRNLFNALTVLRHPTQARFLWIDAIFINQTNIAEGNQQVALMASIYSKASMVFIWIGGDLNFVAVYSFLQVAIKVRDRYPAVLTGRGHSWKVARDVLESGKFEDGIKATLTLLKDPCIFAFLAMAEGWPARYGPDYSLSVEEVYIRFAKYMIMDDGHLQILLDSCYPKDRTLPTWVPDLRCWRRTIPFSERRGDFPLEYNVNSGNPEEVVVGDSNPLQLHLRGAEIDIVESLTDPSPLNPILAFANSGNLLGVWRRVLKGIRTFFLTQFPTFGSYDFIAEEGTTAFIRTITADHLPFSDRDYQQVREWYPILADLMGMKWSDLASSQAEADALHFPPDIFLPYGPADEICHALFVNHLPKTYIPLAVNTQGIFEAVTEILGWIRRMTRRRVFFLTKKGYMGIWPDGMVPGDRVFTFVGGDVPFVLRPVGEEFELVGEAYVHGIMDGELWGGKYGGTELALRDVVLI
ncbi:hypothetical protein IFR05_013455 [Cadophora sp. M221]|nr:hypothetical protein IFR05_013455 [Cadophora sp. M221]